MNISSHSQPHTIVGFRNYVKTNSGLPLLESISPFAELPLLHSILFLWAANHICLPAHTGGTWPKLGPSDLLPYKFRFWMERKNTRKKKRWHWAIQWPCPGMATVPFQKGIYQCFHLVTLPGSWQNSTCSLSARVSFWGMKAKTRDIPVVQRWKSLFLVGAVVRNSVERQCNAQDSGLACQTKNWNIIQHMYTEGYTTNIPI